MMHESVMAWRILKTGIKNLSRNVWLSVAAIAVMVVALLTMSGAIVLNVTTRNIISVVSKQYKVNVFLKEDVSELDRNRLKVALSNNEVVDSVNYIDRETATARFVGREGEESLKALALAGADAIPTSLEISVTDIDKINEVAQVARQSEYEDIVDEVQIGQTDVQKTLERAGAVKRFVTRASIISALIFSVVSVLIIFNTIRIAIFTRSEEIRIMKLIGATPNYIRGPYIVESAMYGVIAGLISSGVLYTAVISLGGKFASREEFRQSYEFLTQPTTIAAFVFGSIVAGILVGVLSSTLAMEKYLKLKRW